MTSEVEPKQIDPEIELSTVLHSYNKVASKCTIEKRSQGSRQLAPQQKQLDLLKHEMKDTLQCIRLGKHGQHALHDAKIKSGTMKSIIQYESLEENIRREKAQKKELDCLNYLAQKRIIELHKATPTEPEEMKIINDAAKHLRRMENRLDIANRKICSINLDNRKMREEINMLIAERNDFNVQWNKTIAKLIKGKEYLDDVLGFANEVFRNRDECCKKLETLKWKGLFELNKDIADMQLYESELNHLANTEEFLRVKGSKRICEADERQDIKSQEEVQRIEKKIEEYDELLYKIIECTGLDSVTKIEKRFQIKEQKNLSLFVLLCEMMQETALMRRELELLRQRVLDQIDINSAAEEKREKTLATLTEQLEAKRNSNQRLRTLNNETDLTIQTMLNGVSYLLNCARCDVTPLINLLGNKDEVTIYNVKGFLAVLESEIKSIIEVGYGSVKPPAPTPKVSRSHGKAPSAPPPVMKLVSDPVRTVLTPNRVEKLVPYLPCAYCVEDYIINLMGEAPVADEEYVKSIFHVEPENTKFGIYTLTVPAKLHHLPRE